MILLHPEEKSSELPCWSLGILNYVKEKYDVLEKECNQTDRLFDLPETQERNAAIITSYLKSHKKTEQFQNLLGLAIDLVLTYDHRLRRRLSWSAYSAEICKKHLDKYVETEWLKDTGKIAADGKDIRKIHDQLLVYRGEAYTLLDDLKRGIECTKEQLKKEEKTLEDYTWSIDKKIQELERLSGKKYSPKDDMFQSEITLLKTILARMEPDLSSKKYRMEDIKSWLELKMSNMINEGKEDGLEEFEKKYKKIDRLRRKYFCLEKEIGNILKHPLLKERGFLTFKN